MGRQVGLDEIETFLRRKLPGLEIRGSRIAGSGHHALDAVYDQVPFSVRISATTLDSKCKRENIAAKVKKILRMKGVTV